MLRVWALCLGLVEGENKMGRGHGDKKGLGSALLLADPKP